MSENTEPRSRKLVLDTKVFNKLKEVDQGLHDAASKMFKAVSADPENRIKMAWYAMMMNKLQNLTKMSEVLKRTEDSLFSSMGRSYNTDKVIDLFTMQSTAYLNEFKMVKESIEALSKSLGSDEDDSVILRISKDDESIKAPLRVKNSEYYNLYSPITFPVKKNSHLMLDSGITISAPASIGFDLKGDLAFLKKGVIITGTTHRESSTDSRFKVQIVNMSSKEVLFYQGDVFAQIRMIKVYRNLEVTVV